jgi:hypothetical protein
MANAPRNRVPELVRLSVAAGLTGLLLGVGVLALGSKGDKLLAALALAMAAATPPIERLLDAWLEGEHRLRLPRGRRTWALIVAFGLLLGLIAYGAWPLWHKTDDNVTDQVQIVNGEPMHDGDTARLALPTPRKRDWLALTLRLESRTPSGLCVDPARLTVNPTVDGVAKQARTTRSGSEVRTRLGEAKREVRVDVTLDIQDEGCAFALKVDEAVFYNRRLPW